MWHEVYHAFIETLRIVPILFLVYLLISYLTHHKEDPYKFLTKKSKRFGPLFGSVLGTIPQCGFSAVMADLFSKRAITLGTLFAVFLATSDEAIPILISNPSWYAELGIIIGVKFLVGIIFGYAIDFILELIEKNKGKTKISKILKEEAMEVHGSLNVVEMHHEHDHEKACSCHVHEDADKTHYHNHNSSCCADNIFVDALIHTLKISGFILLINVILNVVIYYVGMENFIGFVSINEYLQPLVTSLIGLSPNCAASVFLIELMMEGGITLSSTIAGLCIGSGVGLIVLFKNNKNIKQNLLIVVLLYVISVCVGLALTPILH